MSQFELFPQPVAVEPSVPTVESIRARFDALLGRLRGASVMPLTDKELAYWKVVAPQMANWLPEAEREAVRKEFAGHLQRLDGAPTRRFA